MVLVAHARLMMLFQLHAYFFVLSLDVVQIVLAGVEVVLVLA